ncbi:MAG: hypothetical protein ABEJ57_05375 [Halobacteriaceae archaeon]
MAASEGLAPLIEDQQFNTVLGWVLITFVASVVLTSLATGDYAWAAFATGVFVLAVIPPLGFHDRDAMLPWEVLALAALPLVGHTIAGTVLSGQLTTYLSVAGLALIVAVELDVFTAVRMTEWFAILFVVVATMATAGVWAVLRWSADVWLGTTFILEPGVAEAAIEAAVMWEFVYSTAAGIVAGVVFELYFRRRARTETRLPREVREHIR